MLSKELLGGNIWIPPAILSCVKYQWNGCNNKLKQRHFQKTDVGGESQYIFQELAVTSGHTKSFFKDVLEILKHTTIRGGCILASN